MVRGSDDNTRDDPVDAEDAALPLLEGHGLGLRTPEGRELLAPESLTVTGRSLACRGGAMALMRAWIEPESILAGALRCWGQSPSVLLESGRAGYAPRNIPAPDDYHLRDALLLGARLAGFGRSDVDAALDRCQLSRLAGRPLGQLTPLQRALSGLAHALIGAPDLLLVEDSFGELDDAEAELLEATLEPELATRHWIFATEATSPWARRLFDSAEWAMTATAGSLVGPLRPEQITAEGLWIRCGRASQEFEAALRERGARVTTTAEGTTHLVRGASGLVIVDCARASGTPLLEMTPTEAAVLSER